MFDLRLRHAEHTRHYSITSAKNLGWVVKLEEDQKLRRLDHYHDWHRVERALASFEREVDDLQRRGWRVAARDIPSNQWGLCWCSSASRQPSPPVVAPTPPDAGWDQSMNR